MKNKRVGNCRVVRRAILNILVSGESGSPGLVGLAGVPGADGIQVQNVF